MEKWFLGQYKPGKANLQRVQYQLALKSINSWTPQIFTSRKTDDGKLRKCVEALFPGYIFIEFDIERHHPSVIAALPGMSDFVSFGGEIQEVHYSVIAELMSYPISYAEPSMNHHLSRSPRLTRRQRLAIRDMVSSTDPLQRTAMLLALHEAISDSRAAA
ncbi:TPA: transcription termination/antitermination NusG family protein [Klebsiella oxytoca]